MAISNVQHVINDELIRTRIDPVNPEQAQKTNKNIKNQKMTEISTKEPLKEIMSDKMNEQDIHDAIDKLNQTAQIFNKKIKLSVHEESKRVVIKIVDSQTDKVIREIPAKEALNFITKLHDLIGVLIDKKQ